MSLSYQPLNPVLVRDPITEVDVTRDYAILKGGNQVTWKKYTTTSISNSAITFSCPPPSGNVFVDRKMYFLLPVRLTFTGVGAGTGNLLNPGQDAPRAFPISSNLETLQAAVNGQSFSIFISDMIQALSHYNTDIKLHNRDYSMTPTYYDQTQAYADLAVGNVRNPLGGYQNGIDHTPMQRGGFPFTIVSNTPTSAVVDVVFCEPLFLSPFYFGCGNASGFYNVTTMDFNFTFLSNSNRWWSHNNQTLSNPISNITAQFSNFNTPAFSYAENQPILLFKYITPDETQVLSPNMPITYPYFDVQRYPLDFPSSVPGGGVLSSFGLINSNNLQLNSIPRMMYVFARTRNQDLYAPGTGCTLTDTYLALQNINITFANYTGLLSSASQYQLYQVAAKNGCGMNWTQWSGQSQNNPASWTTPIAQYGTIGSVFAVEFATDLGLPSDMCPGLQGQFQLQINAQFINTGNNPINATLYIIIVSEGSFTIPGLNSATRQLGVITKNDILNAKEKPGVSYDQVRESLYGGEGNFFSNLRDFGSKVLDFLRGSKIISTVASAIPHPIAQTIGTVARNIGLGDGRHMAHHEYMGHGDHMGYGDGYGSHLGAIKGWETRYKHMGHGEGGVIIDPSQYHDYGCGEGVSVGGVPVGGKKMSKKELKNRLKKM